MSNPASPLASFPGLSAPSFPSTRDTPTADPELKQLNDMLEKVLDVQHPERVKERLLEASAKEPARIFTVTPAPACNLSYWPAKDTDSTRQRTTLRKAIKAASRFYELDQEDATAETPNTIPAVVHETKTVVTGGSVKLRLTSAVVVHGQEIPAGTTVEGVAELSGERLKISIDKIVSKGSIIPVNLRVYDASGLEGIYEPGAIARDASKQGADQAMQSMQLASLNPSLGAQAAASGIETVKTLLSKKVRLISVTVKSGTPVLLYSDHYGQ